MSPAARIAVVAGSGIALDPILTEISHRQAFCDVPGLLPSAVPGHAGTFTWGRCGNVETVVQQGRLHLYEGLDPETVVRPVDILAELGVSTVIFTNAAGGLRPDLPAGSLLAVESIGLWPCRAWPDAPDTLETDFAIPGCDGQGVYRWVHGPCYETRAEIRALQALGGSAVGMSTAPELRRCRELGIRAAVVSCITNCCCVPQILTHDHVVTTAARLSSRLAGILAGAIAAIAAD